MPESDKQDFEHSYNLALDLFDQMDYHYQEYKNAREQCQIIQNYLNNHASKHHAFLDLKKPHQYRIGIYILKVKKRCLGVMVGFKNEKSFII
jgi:hypothetical protein